MEPCERPRAFLPSGPLTQIPLTIVSFQLKSFGNNNDMHCNPVHNWPSISGSGRTAPSTHIQILHISALSRVTPRLVIINEESNES